MGSLTRARAAAEAPTLLNTLARAPAAAALIVGELLEESAMDVKALSLTHTQLRDVVREHTTSMLVDMRAAAPPPPPTPHRWPRLERLTLFLSCHNAMDTLEALGSGTWRNLVDLELTTGTDFFPDGELKVDAATRACRVFDVACARAFAAALRNMPTLRKLTFEDVALPDAAAAELFRASCEDAPELHEFSLAYLGLSPAAMRSLATSGWKLKNRLSVSGNEMLGGTGVAALLAAPTFAPRILSLSSCGLDAAALLNVANVPWPLETLYISDNDFSAAAAGLALAALSQNQGTHLRCLDMTDCELSATGFKVLVETTWPALTHLRASRSKVKVDALSKAAAFANFPSLKLLDVSYVKLCCAGLRLLARRRWEHLFYLDIRCAGIDDAGFELLLKAHGAWAWPALETWHGEGRRRAVN